LDDFGFERDIAENGKIVEKMQFYDVILMDLQMPEMNGFEATNIRTTMNKIPIIALTPMLPP
jgi:CheY-like chemotaxis protein